MKRNDFTALFLSALAAITVSLCGCSSPSPSPSPIVVTAPAPGAAPAAPVVTPEDKRYLDRYGRDSSGNKTR